MSRPAAPRRLGRRGQTLLGIAAAALLAVVLLGLGPAGLLPRGAGLELMRELGGAALSPALDYEVTPPPGAELFWAKVASNLWSTILYAAAAMALALPIGMLLGLAAADVTWERHGGVAPPLARGVQWAVRVWIALLRSVHELLWAILFLAALGLNPAAGVFAIAIPFAGTIAKVSSELLDEAPRDAGRALVALGAGAAPALLVGVLPRALPDIASYAFYRFECALRSAAVLGFFGAPTIGQSVALSFENAQFREMWTYVYALVGLVLLVEALGARLRRSMS